MAAYKTELIIPDRSYRMTDASRLFNVSVSTLRNWRKSGRLVVGTKHKTRFTGQRLLEAIWNMNETLT